MKMSKRSYAELRKIRKREQTLIEAMAEIKATNDGESDQPIDDIIRGCITELNEINKKEEFLQDLELPKHDNSAADILAKIRARSSNPPPVTPATPAVLQKLKKSLGLIDDDE